jgi:hypothetical protein
MEVEAGQRELEAGSFVSGSPIPGRGGSLVSASCSSPKIGPQRRRLRRQLGERQAGGWTPDLDRVVARGCSGELRWGG